MKSDNFMSLGNRIKIARENSGFTQPKLAKMVGKTANTLRRYEQGEISPSVETVKKIAEATGLDLIKLLG